MLQETTEADGYDFPDDLGKAEQAYADLAFEVESIQGQLGDRNRTASDGKRLDDAAYWEWRVRAVAALRYQLAELRALKRHVRELRQDRPRTGRTGIDVVNDLVSAYRADEADRTLALLTELAQVWEAR